MLGNVGQEIVDVNIPRYCALGQHRRVHVTRANRIDAKPVGSVVQRHGPGELDQAALAHTIGECPRAGAQPPIGRNIDDAAFRFQQAGQCGPRQIERHIEIDRHRVPPVIVTRLFSVATRQNAGRIDQAVDGTELVDRVGDELIAVIRLDEIASPGRDAVGDVRDFRQSPLVTPGRHHVPARIGKLNRGRCPDSGARPCNECNIHVRSPIVSRVSNSISFRSSDSILPI